MVDDFLRVTIRFRDGSEQTDFHASISEIPEVSEQEETHSSPLNVMILAFDGTSAAHFERMLPKTYTYLKDNLESIMVKGYSVVGESTTPQLTALLTGRSLEENCDFSEARKEYASSTFVDVWPFIYKDLKRLGIVTMWSEDDYHIGKASLNSVAIAGKIKLAGKVFGDKVFNVFFLHDYWWNSRISLVSRTWCLRYAPRSERTIFILAIDYKNVVMHGIRGVL